MKCPKCQYDIITGAKKCEQCSKPLEWCPHCGALVERTDKVCGTCARGLSGKALLDVVPLSPDERARLAAGPDHPDTKKCPYCAEEIKWEASVCRFCHRELVGRGAGTVPTTAPTQPKWNPGVAAVLSLIIPGAGQMYKGQIVNGLVWLVVVVGGYVAFIFPGLILHVCCIVGAASGNPNK